MKVVGIWGRCYPFMGNCDRTTFKFGKEHKESRASHPRVENICWGKSQVGHVQCGKGKHTFLMSKISMLV